MKSNASKFNNNSNITKSNSCNVCGDEARIINYGTLSCQSCKTFFRRNGYRPQLVPPCRHDGKCEVNILTRKMCTICRLKKCFTMGMSSDFIRKEDNYLKKYNTSKCKKLMSVSQLQTLDILQNDRSLLNNSDWTLFSNVIHAYDRFSLTPKLDLLLKDLSSSSNEITFQTTNVFEIVAYVFTSMRLFISSTPDFQVLSINEQQSLFKRNLFVISALCSNIFYRDTNFLNNSICHNGFIEVYGKETIKQAKYFIEQLDFDSTLFKLILLALAFSSNCMIIDVHNNIHNDSLIFSTFRLLSSQNIYIELLWKYMIYRYGYNETIIRFSKIIQCVLTKIKQIANIYINHDVHHDFINKLIEKTNETLIINQNKPNLLWGKTFLYNSYNY